MTATIQIEFGPGTKIEDAFREAIRISKILGCTTEFKFNDVTCWGCAEGDAEVGAKAYFKALKDKSIYGKYAHSALF